MKNSKIKLNYPIITDRHKSIKAIFPTRYNISTTPAQINEMMILQYLIAKKTQLVRELSIKLEFNEAGLAILTAKINKLEKI